MPVKHIFTTQRGELGEKDLVLLPRQEKIKLLLLLSTA